MGGGSTEVPLGVQWDAAGGTPQTLPLGWNGGSVVTIFGRFVTLSTTYDFDTGRCWASYGATTLPSQPFQPGTLLDFFYMWLGHDEATGSGPEKAWLDNLQISYVPEPAAGVLVALTLLLARRR